MDLSVLVAVERDLGAIRRRDTGLAESALAASALVLAQEMDDPSNSATSKSMCARVLLDTLEKLRELAPAEEEKDSLDELTARRLARLGGAATSDPSRS